MNTPPPVEHFFRHEYARLVASLARRVGFQHLESVEDAVQSALLTAIDLWPANGEPRNPGAWLHRVARNNLMAQLRQQGDRREILARKVLADEPVAEGSTAQEDLLRMLFVCCNPHLPRESQVVLALKTLCGFDVAEIALRLFANEAGVYKRLARARAELKQQPATAVLDLSTAEAAKRVSGVNAVIYVLFTEGYLTSSATPAVRAELCEEAIRLARLVADSKAGARPETFALLALMHLHAARADARQDAAGALLLLEEQDRSRWDRTRIAEGLAWLERSASGECFSRYHAEASIAAEHCLAPSFAETRWDRIVSSYELLERAAPSPVHALNRAVALAEWRGVEVALAAIDGLDAPNWVTGSYLWSAVLADLHRRGGNLGEATRHRRDALLRAPTDAVRALLVRRLGG